MICIFGRGQIFTGLKCGMVGKRDSAVSFVNVEDNIFENENRWNEMIPSAPNSPSFFLNTLAVSRPSAVDCDPMRSRLVNIDLQIAITKIAVSKGWIPTFLSSIQALGVDDKKITSNVYAYQKRQIEGWYRQYLEDYVILRLGWWENDLIPLERRVDGIGASIYNNLLIRGEHDQLAFAKDQSVFFTPNSKLVQLLEYLSSQKDRRNALVLNAFLSNGVSRYEIAKAIAIKYFGKNFTVSNIVAESYSRLNKTGVNALIKIPASTRIDRRFRFFDWHSMI